MSREKSPFKKTKISIVKLGEVMEMLAAYDRTIWVNMCKGSKVRLLEGNVRMGPMPNWKAYKILCLILTFEQDKSRKNHASSVRMATLMADPAKLFLTT